MAAPATQLPRQKASLVTIPAELQAMITKNLPTHLDKLALQYACTGTNAFQNMPRLQDNELRDIERKVASIWGADPPLACGTCRKLVPPTSFTDNMMKSTKKRRGGIDADERVCIDCGVLPDEHGHRLYTRESIVRIRDVKHVVCVRCIKVRPLAGETRAERKRRLCAACLVAPPPPPKEPTPPPPPPPSALAFRPRSLKRKR